MRAFLIGGPADGGEREVADDAYAMVITVDERKHTYARVRESDTFVYVSTERGVVRKRKPRADDGNG